MSAAEDYDDQDEKFGLVESGSRRAVVFGSFNWTEPSRRLNREIGVIARDSSLFDAFAARWQNLSAAASDHLAPGKGI